MPDGLKIIEDELVPVYQTDKGSYVVNGRELHKVLQSKTDFSTWVKRRLNECDAVQNEDYCLLPKIEEQVSGAKRLIEYIIKLDTAKEMAMLEKNAIGKRVRKYFIEVDKRYKQQVIDRSQLSPRTQALMGLIENQARYELEQKRQAEKIEALEAKAERQTEVIQTVKDTFVNAGTDEDFRQWVNKSINQIANTEYFSYGNSYSAARAESYKRLTDKANCRLGVLVENAIRRAEARGATRAQINSINRMSVIMENKRLRELYAVVIKEMLLAYCVEANLKGGTKYGNG